MKFLGDINPDDYMFVNAIYNRKNDKNNSDYLYVIYKNRKTGEKFVKTIKEPTMDYYVTKEEYRDYDYHKDFMPLDKLELKTARYKNISFDVAKESGPDYENYIKNAISSGNYRDIGKIHGLCNNVFGSDIPIETWYKIQYQIEYGSDNVIYPITRTFLDIEVDGIDIEGFPKPGECPINAVTMIDDLTKTSYTFLLRNPRNPQIQEFEDSIEEFKKELANDFDDTYGKIEYKFFMYDEDKEIDLIRDLFKLINTLKRDFCLIWNQNFDIPFIIERIHTLGYEHESIVCHKDFETKSAFFVTSKANMFAEKTDKFICNSYTRFLDQLVVYSGLRKGGGTIRSHKLNDIGKKEVNDAKLDYSEDADIKTLPYKNYKMFVKYGIKDVLLQLGIDNKTQDVENLYLRTLKNATPYERAFKQTTFLKNAAYISFFKQGYVICNNKPFDENNYSDNIIKTMFDESDGTDDDDEDEQFEGAIVADPELNGYNGIKIFGKSSKYVYDYVTDEDFAQMYPNVIFVFNVCGSTLIGKLTVDLDHKTVVKYYDLNEKEISRFDAGKEFIEAYLSDNLGLLGEIFFGLPPIDELLEGIGEEYGL
ncbi:MAG: DNA polymerase domain-containing protein [Peptostreptococcaceae bacterium]